MVDRAVADDDLPGEAKEPLDAILARIAERHSRSSLEHYSIDDLAKIPPCPICGARARIENGRLAQPCIREKHTKHVEPPAPVTTAPVQRSLFGEEARVVGQINDAPSHRPARKEWWHD